MDCDPRKEQLEVLGPPGSEPRVSLSITSDKSVGTSQDSDDDELQPDGDRLSSHRINCRESENKRIIRDADSLELENQKLKEDLERLKDHLIQVEDGYTQELLLAEERESQFKHHLTRNQERIESLERQLQTTSGLNVLKEHLKKVTTERDAAQKDASTLDDQLQKSQASHSRLQLLIEQTRNGGYICKID